MVEKIKCNLLYKSNNWENGKLIRSIDIKLIDRFYHSFICYVNFNLYNKLLNGRDYTLYIVTLKDNSVYGFETEFEAKIFDSLLTVKGIGNIKAMEIMRIFTPYHPIVRSLNYLQKVKFTDYHGINQKLSDNLNKKFVNLWQEGILND